MSWQRRARRLVVLVLASAAGGCGGSIPSGPASNVPSVGVPTATASSEAPASSGATSSATATGALEPFGSLLATRASHSATLLADGRVLIAGGCVELSCEGVTAGTERVDAASGTSSVGPVMTEPRGGHVAVPLPDGRLFIVGGFGPNSVTASTEFFDPSTGAFRAGPEMAEPRADPTALLLDDGTVLVAGGFDGRRPLASAEVFDPTTNDFRPTGSLATARAGQASALLVDGRVLVAGGNAGADRGTGTAVQATAEVYDPGAGTWKATGEMTIRRHKHAAMRLDDGRVLVAGGSDERDGRGVYRSAEVYEPASGTFTATGEMVAPRYKIQDAIVRLADGRVLLGRRRHDGRDLRPSTGSFEAVPGDAEAGWSFAAAVRLPDGSVIVSGGYDDTITLTDQILRYVT